MTHVELKNKLQAIAHQTENTIEKQVALAALNHNYEELQNFFSDILHHGCISGMIGSLVYHKDTHTFFDTHYNQIEELRQEYEENTGIPLSINFDLKNDLS